MKKGKTKRKLPEVYDIYQRPAAKAAATALADWLGPGWYAKVENIPSPRSRCNEGETYHLAVVLSPCRNVVMMVRTDWGDQELMYTAWIAGADVTQQTRKTPMGTLRALIESVSVSLEVRASRIGAALTTVRVNRSIVGYGRRSLTNKPFDAKAAAERIRKGTNT